MISRQLLHGVILIEGINILIMQLCRAMNSASGGDNKLQVSNIPVGLNANKQFLINNRQQPKLNLYHQ